MEPRPADEARPADVLHVVTADAAGEQHTRRQHARRHIVDVDTAGALVDLRERHRGATAVEHRWALQSVARRGRVVGQVGGDLVTVDLPGDLATRAGVHRRPVDGVRSRALSELGISGVVDVAGTPVGARHLDVERLVLPKGPHLATRADGSALCRNHTEAEGIRGVVGGSAILVASGCDPLGLRRFIDSTRLLCWNDREQCDRNADSGETRNSRIHDYPH